MAILLGIPVIILVVILQTVVITTLPLLNGIADLVLLVVAAWSLQNRLESDYSWAVIGGLVVGLITRVPWFIPLIGYLFVTFLANILRRQVWQTRVLGMLISVRAGSVVLLLLEWGALLVQGVPLPLEESLNLVVLPSTFLNLLFALPVYALVTELYQSVFPEEVVV